MLSGTVRVTQWPKHENLHPEFTSSDHSVARPAFTGSGLMFTIYNFEQCRIVQFECVFTRVFYRKVSQLVRVAVIGIPDVSCIIRTARHRYSIVIRTIRYVDE